MNRITPDDRCAEFVSSYLVAVYCGYSLPVIDVGLVSDWAGCRAAHLTFAVVIARRGDRDRHRCRARRRHQVRARC